MDGGGEYLLSRSGGYSVVLILGVSERLADVHADTVRRHVAPGAEDPDRLAAAGGGLSGSASAIRG
jgi:hypothetical protein